MFAPVIIYFIVFSYLPMFGVVLAFKEYNFRDGILGSPWVGLKYFGQIFSQPLIFGVIKNTLLLSILNLLTGFPFPIILAILLNEIKKQSFKRIIQTAVYLPHFLSWVIIGGIVTTLFASTSGTINNIFVKPFNNGQGYEFLYNWGSWLSIYLGSGIWKEMGFSAIIYLSALGTIDPALYEAVHIDGGGKFKQIWHVTLPGLRPTIVLLLILALGRLMNVGFDQVFVLQNSAVLFQSDIISTWIYRVGIRQSQFSITSAMGLFNSVINFILIVTSNRIARKFDQSLW